MIEIKKICKLKHLSNIVYFESNEIKFSNGEWKIYKNILVYDVYYWMIVYSLKIIII